jgi:hypothetical protein
MCITDYDTNVLELNPVRWEQEQGEVSRFDAVGHSGPWFCQEPRSVSTPMRSEAFLVVKLAPQ